jgi:hypothetical protein
MCRCALGLARKQLASSIYVALCVLQLIVLRHALSSLKFHTFFAILMVPSVCNAVAIALALSLISCFFASSASRCAWMSLHLCNRQQQPVGP